MPSRGCPRVKLGITRLLENPRAFLGRTRVGLVGSYNLVDEQARSVIRLFHEHADVNLAALFCAEHGLWEAAQAGIRVDGGVDPHTGVRVFSLYGESLRPTAQMMREVDVLVYDSADIGCRYFTSVSTMSLCMEAAAEAGKPIIVADRPNPLGGVAVEGNVLKAAFRSFVGCQPIPIRHGMTAGELAGLFNGEFAIGADLTVIPAEGWSRDMLFPGTGLFWASSPNMPGFETALVYPGTCLFEATTCSEGRGTTKPFRVVGAPWLDAIGLADALNEAEVPGVRFRPVRFAPWFSKHQGKECGGVEVHVTDPALVESVYLGLALLCEARRQGREAFGWRGLEGEGEAEAQPGAGSGTGRRRLFIDRLAGGTELRAWIESGLGPREIVERWKPEVAAFNGLRTQYLLYRFPADPHQDVRESLT